MGKTAKKDDSIIYLEGVQKEIQDHLHILNKTSSTILPRFIAFAKLPSIEAFMPSLEDELNEKDLTQEERDALLHQNEEEVIQEETNEDIVEEPVVEDIKEEPQIEEEIEEQLPEEIQEEQEQIVEDIKEETIDEEQIKAEEEARIKAEEEAKAKAEEEARIKAEEAAKAKAEEEARIKTEEEAQAKAEEEARIKAEEEAKAKAKKEATSNETQSSKVINFETLKNKRKPTTIVKKSTMMKGGVSAALMESQKLKEELESIKKEEAQERAQKRKEELEKEEQERLANAILIGNTKKPSPELGKFEIQLSNDKEKPFKFVLKTEKGKVVFETAPMKTKPNELTAVMFKDIMANGSFAFMRTNTGFFFKILDSRQRVFCTSRAYPTTLDAQKAAALIKKYGLSANYIDDKTI